MDSRTSVAFTVQGITHEVGNVECPSCWCAMTMGPCDCGGLVHQQFLDESRWPDDVMIYEKCDRCLG